MTSYSNPPIPKLPGYTVSLPQSLGDKRLPKNQTLTYVNGYQREDAVREVKDPKPRMESTGYGIDSPVATGTFSPSKAFQDSPSQLPQWVENDRKVLRFFGYYKEPVVESNVENHRVRKVILHYYLEDDSMHLAEPRQDNSGIPQGTMVKRHKFLKEDSSSFFNPSDFAVGQMVTVYGRTLFLVDADPFTREWYRGNMGVELEEPLPYPDDPVDVYRSTFGMLRGAGKGNTTNQRLDDFKAYIEARLGKPSHLLEGDKLRQFLENNRKVLRFWCVWDDRQSMYGDRRPYILHYFLEDDTVEVLELNESNSGRDPFPVFLRRTLLPKSGQKMHVTGARPRKKDCYTPADLRLGTYVSVYNRDFLLYDCDRFTKAWLMDNLGYSMEELTPIELKEPELVLPKPALPPHNGYGAIEDSLQNCLSLVPKPPRRDMHKLMNKDKIILRFTVRMKDSDTHRHTPIDLQRRFVLSYFMMDDTIQVFEPPVRNSGIAGGKFLEKQRVFKPGTEEVYTCTDLFVGALIEVYNRTFELFEADEYTLTYMENNKHIFIMADFDVLIKSLRAQASGKADVIRTALIELDREGSGRLSGPELEAALRAAGLKLTKHQAITLERQLDQERNGQISILDVQAALGISD